MLINLNKIYTFFYNNIQYSSNYHITFRLFSYSKKSSLPTISILAFSPRFTFLVAFTTMVRIKPNVGAYGSTTSLTESAFVTALSTIILVT